jgi:hypothetical protein
MEVAPPNIVACFETDCANAVRVKRRLSHPLMARISSATSLPGSHGTNRYDTSEGSRGMHSDSQQHLSLSR